MTNQLEQQLQAIQYTITKKQQLRNTDELTPIQRNNLTHQIQALQQEEQRILKEIGVTGELL